MAAINQIQPHINFGKADARPVCIVVGDPARAALYASMCDEHKEVAYKREYRTFLCKKDGAEFLIASHGVGSSGAAICFEELIKNGVKVIMRAGTAGSLQPDAIKQGDVVVCHAAAREDGISNLLVPAGMPAVADPHVYKTMEAVAKSQSFDVKFGISLSSDSFYGEGALEGTLPVWAKSGVDIVEMEVSTLFIIAKLRGIKAGALCSIDGCPFKWNDGDYDPAGNALKKAVANMAAIVLATAIKLAKEEK